MVELALSDSDLEQIVRRALDEDIGSGDITTQAAVPYSVSCRAQIVGKESGIVAGLPVAQITFRALSDHIQFEAQVEEGSGIQPGLVLARLAGPARPVLTAERTALNFLQRMSGIATLTAQFVRQVKGSKARILDTRKTAPGLRLLDKYAVRAGGGHNHRMGLSNGILIKDNHIGLAGGIAPAVAATRKDAHHGLKVEVEAQNLNQVTEALEAGADIIMLDNMPLAQLQEAVQLVAGRALIEASGGVSLENVAEIAATGVDFISVGSLTHSAPALDISLEIEPGTDLS